MITTVFVLGLMTAIAAPAAAAESRGALKVDISNLRHTEGQVLVSLYSRAEGFPRDHEAIYREMTLHNISSESVSVSFDDLPHGEYAVAILHDENRNFDMDYNFLNLPKEGYGFSNNVKPRLKAPSFEAAKLTLAGPIKVIEISVHY